MRTLRLVTLFFLAILVLLPFVAFAQTTSTDPGSIITGILTAFTGKKWLILAGYIIVGIVYLVRTYLLKSWAWAQTVRGGACVAIAIAVLSTLGAELIAGITSLMTILDAVLAALVAIGGFTVLNDIITPSKSATKATPVDAPVKPVT